MRHYTNKGRALCGCWHSGETSIVVDEILAGTAERWSHDCPKCLEILPTLLRTPKDDTERKTPMDPQAVQGAEGAHAIARALRDAELNRRLEKEGPGAGEVRAHAAQFEKEGPTPPPSLVRKAGEKTVSEAFGGVGGGSTPEEGTRLELDSRGCWTGKATRPPTLKEVMGSPMTEAEETAFAEATGKGMPRSRTIEIDDRQPTEKDRNPAREFTPGMSVKLRGGKVLMTVEHVSEGEGEDGTVAVECVWHSKRRKVRRGAFLNVTLMQH